MGTTMMKINILAVLGLSLFGSGHAEDVSDTSVTTATTYAAAPEYDIGLDSCEFTPNSDGSDIGDITCTFTASGGVDHSVSSAIYANDCISALALTGVVQDENPSFSPALASSDTTQ